MPCNARIPCFLSPCHTYVVALLLLTSIMGLAWSILSIDNHETLNWGWAGMSPWLKDPGCLVDVLCVPVKPSIAPSSSSILSKTSRFPAEGSEEPCQTQPCLTALPNELLMGIFHHLDLVSAFRFSLISQRMWNVGWPCVQTKGLDLMAPWAGSRIVCMGAPVASDYDDKKAPPECLLTAEEETVLHEGLENEQWKSQAWNSKDLDPRSGHLLRIVHARARTVQYRVEPYKLLLHPLPNEPNDRLGSEQPSVPPRSALEEATFLPPSQLSEILDALGRNTAQYYPTSENWVLSNLTIRAFLRADGLSAAFKSRRQSRIDTGWPGLGEALLCRICWNTGCASEGFGRGVWAGHRFEICTEKQHVTHSDDRWNDVTNELVSELSVAFKEKLKGKDMNA